MIQLLHFNKSCEEYLKQHPSPIVFSLDRTRSQTHIRAGNGVHAQYLAYRKLDEGKLKGLSFSLNPLHRMLLSIEKRAFEQPELKLLFANSHRVRQEILEHYNVDPKKIVVIHNGVEWQQMQPIFDRWEEQKIPACKKFGLDPHVFQFLFIGHNYRRKGLDKLLLALSHLSHYNFQLSVIGREKNLNAYRYKTEKLGLRDKVFFFGSSQEIFSFYQLADALVIPSLYDPFANVTVEALAMGLFVISSKTNGGSEVLTKDSGVIIDTLEDSHSFTAALKTALTHPKKAKQAMHIRSSVQHLDFSRQLRVMTMLTIEKT